MWMGQNLWYTICYWLLYQFNRYFDVRCTRVLIRPKNPCTMDDPWSLSTLGATLWPSRRHCPWYQVVGQGRLQLPLPLLRHGGLPADSKIQRWLEYLECQRIMGCQSVFVSIASILVVLKLWRHWHPHVLFSGGGRQTLSFLDGWPSGAGHVTVWFERGGQAAIEIQIRSFLVGRIYWNLLKSSAILVESWSLKYQVL